jgi:1,4-alpha-glucan branching enzyme
MMRAHAMPFGATVLPDGGIPFRLWAPTARTIAVRLVAGDTRPTRPMQPSERAIYDDDNGNNTLQMMRSCSGISRPWCYVEIRP